MMNIVAYLSGLLTGVIIATPKEKLLEFLPFFM
ncbi:MAG: hypothetical protein G01um101456_207 [Parcubacteria group bacterium Gr01-1014_56]|nr:MAG: hypothetical protein G01um101456_207 [Parcubacteria group bacterium Gr01-1014_56]